jgi:RNA polymerase sigma-70 factor (ECF subfamily)
MDGRGVTPRVVESGSGFVGFGSTTWTAVVNAQAQETAVAKKNLELLIERYWRPVYSFIRQFGNDHEAAKDLTQGFFTAFVERDIVSYADRERGKFRTFLMASIKRYLALQHRHQVRHPVPAPLSDIDVAARESSFQSGLGEAPERAFARNWAKSLLENCIARFREECRALSKELRYRAFEERFLVDPQRFAPYAQIAAKLGITVSEVRKHLERGRKRLARMIREEVAHSVGTPNEREGELQELVGCLR